MYESDPVSAPDAEFEPGALEHLVPGARGRLLDVRRTPVQIVAVELATGMFEVEVGAFEDAGARWAVAFEEAGRFQFALGGERAGAGQLALYTAAIERLDRPLTIAAPAATVEATAARLA
ncbi:MAG: hypothetical protein QOG68_730, partial [Solirubrobacteraceae bacterium]|nr:hypothetical protein [Solirubrobacteraceae bacterium]